MSESLPQPIRKETIHWDRGWCNLVFAVPLRTEGENLTDRVGLELASDQSENNNRRRQTAAFEALSVWILSDLPAP
jgi:hypothetical protein